MSLADNETDNWQEAWAPMVASVGLDYSDGATQWGADRVEAGAIRRILEPLEISSPVHYDAEEARARGYGDIIAPASSLLSFTIAPMWRPGEPSLFDDDRPDAQPVRSVIDNPDAGTAPPTTGFFATDLSIEFRRPVQVGERVGLRGRRLVSCVPKQTSVGRGAFGTFETEIISDRGDVVAVMRSTTYAYNPNPSSEPQ
jgi:hypothetical protein